MSFRPQGYRIRNSLLLGQIGDNLAADLEQQTDELAGRVTDAVHTRGRQLRDRYRAQAKANFSRIPRGWVPRGARGQNLEKAVQDRRYPSSRKTLGPASLVFIPWRLASVFAAATFINPLGPGFLWIPTEEAFKRGYVRAEVNRGGGGKFDQGNLQRMSRPDLARRALGAAGVALRYVRVSPDEALMGIDADDADDLGMRAARKRVGPKGQRRRTRFVPLFVGVKNVMLRQRFDFDGPLDQAERDLGSDLRGIFG